MTDNRDKESDDYILGESDDLLSIASSDENRLMALSMTQQATKNLCLFSPSLDALLYDNGAFSEAVSALARRNRHTTVQLLIHDADPIIKSGHRMIQLARQQSSSIQIRLTDRQHRTYPSAFLVIDERGLIFRQSAERYAAECCFNAPMRSRVLHRTFQAMWDHGTSDPNLIQQPL